jgi:hypothetical protein
MVVDRLASLLGDFEFDGPACLPLADRCPVHRVAVRGDIIDVQAHSVTAPKLAIDRDIEKHQVPRSAGDLKSRPDGPDVFRLERRFGSSELPFVPCRILTVLRGRGTAVFGPKADLAKVPIPLPANG